MIHPTAVVDPSAEIGANVEIGPFCFVGPGVQVGDGTRLLSHVTLTGRAQLGERNEIHPGAVVGGVPQDKSYKGEDTHVRVGSDNVLREAVTVNLGTVKGGGETTIGDRNLIMACSHIGHDCHVRNDTVISNHVLLAGHVLIEDRAVMGGNLAVHHFSRIGTMAFVGGTSGVEHDIPPYCVATGRPARTRALNIVGLTRNQVSDEEVKDLRKVYSLLFRSDEPKSKVLQQDPDLQGECSRYLWNFMRERVSSPTGRYQELFRTDRKVSPR